jgi:hypothetical protein
MERIELTADEAMTELCLAYNDAVIDPEHEFTVRQFAKKANLSYSHAACVLNRGVTDGSLTVRRVRADTGRWVSAYRWAS